MKKTRHLVMLVAAVVVVLAVGAVSAYASLADDATPPATTSDAAGPYWNDAVITLTATDAEGIAYIYHELDDDVVRLHTVAGGPTSATLTAPRDWNSELEPLAPGQHTLKFWAQDVNGNVEVKHSATFTVKADHDAPVTTATGAPTSAWVNTAVTVHLASTDGAGCGVKQITSVLDSAAPVVFTGVTTDVAIAGDGTHTLKFQAEDVLANAETEQSLTVNIDTVQPTPKAPYAATAYRGRTATLKYKVVDAAPNGGTASVKIVVKNPAGKIVKTKSFTGKALDTVFTYKFTVSRTWKPGTYKFLVSATDTAGNASAKAAVNKLIIR